VTGLKSNLMAASQREAYLNFNNKQLDARPNG